MQNSCWFTSSHSQNCHNIFIYCFLLLSLGCFFVLIGNYYLPSQRKHKVLEGKDACIVSPVFSGEQKYVCKSLNAMLSSEKIKEYLRGSSCENVQEECKKH